MNNEITFSVPCPGGMINILGMEGYQTKIEGNTIRVRPKWISVKDKFPLMQGDVLVWDGQDIFIACWCDWGNYQYDQKWKSEDRCYSDAGGNLRTNPTHWMPLPEPPNE